MDARQILDVTKKYVSTYLPSDGLPIIVAVANPKETKIGISIQRAYPLTMIERGYGVPFGRFRSDAVRLLSDPDELHGYKWSIETHEAVFEADAATDVRLQSGMQRRVPIKLSTGIGNILQNLRSVAYVDRTPYMVVGERPDHPPPYACLVEYVDRDRRIGVELLLFNELGGCQRVDKTIYRDSPVEATIQANPKFEEKIRWAVSGYPLVLDGTAVSLELTTRNVSDFRHVWRLPKLQKSLVQHLATISAIKDAAKRIEFYFGFDEIREKRTFVLATRNKTLTLPLELAMTQEWVETMCNVCKIQEAGLSRLKQFDSNYCTFRYLPEEVAADFLATDYKRMDAKDNVQKSGDFFVDTERLDLSVKLLPAIYPHHIVGLNAKGQVVNISICGQSGRSGITVHDAKELCLEVKLTDALILDNGNDVFSRYEGKNPIAHRGNTRQTRLTAALHFAELMDPGPTGRCDVQSGEVTVHCSRSKRNVD
jgi:hypothetical protein